MQHIRNKYISCDAFYDISGEDKQDWAIHFTTTQKSIQDIMLNVKANISYDLIDFMRLFFLIPREELIAVIDPNILVAQQNINDACNLFYHRIDEKWSDIMREKNNAPRKRMNNWLLYEDVFRWLQQYQKYIFSQKKWRIEDNLPRSSKFSLKNSQLLSVALRYIRENWPIFRDCLLELTDPYYTQNIDSFWSSTSSNSEILPTIRVTI